jgi:hypothetical protein
MHELTVNAMRPLTFLFLYGLCISVYAAQPAYDTKSPPPPPSLSADTAPEEPQITIIQQPETMVEEYRAGGRLYMIKITPKVGKPYYLVDDQGDGKFSRQESLDSGVRPPRWIIHQF